MWELTEKACKLYLARMKRDRCYGKKKTGIEKMAKRTSLSGKWPETGRGCREWIQGRPGTVQSVYYRSEGRKPGDSRTDAGLRTAESGYGGTGSWGES